jgi:hypothetical protein
MGALDPEWRERCGGLVSALSGWDGRRLFREEDANRRVCLRGRTVGRELAGGGVDL